MAFKHRKLIFDLNYINITGFCEPFCDPILNDNRICPPLICKSTCPFTCTNPFPSLIPPPNPPPSTNSDDHRPNKELSNAYFYLIISLSVLAVFCFVFSTYSIYKYYKNRNRASEPRQQQQGETHDDHDQFLDEEHGHVLDHPIWYIRTIGLQQSAINAITICKYKRGDGLVEGTDCSVCLNEFQEDETLRLLPKCNHAFHLPCIDTWLRSHTNCPMCRAGIVTDISEPVQEPDAAVREESQVVMVVEEDIEGEAEDTSEEDEVGKVQPMRRSVSLDWGNSSVTQLVKLEDLNVGDGSKRACFGRSVSCSGNVLMKISAARSQQH